MKNVFSVLLVGILCGCSSYESFHCYVEKKDENSSKRNLHQEEFSLRGVPFGIDASVAASLRGDKDLSHGIYLYRINCRDAFCSVTLSIMNECHQNNKGAVVFSPKYFQWSDVDNNLSVRRFSDTGLEISVFQAPGKKLPAKITLNFSDDSSVSYYKKLQSLSVSGLIDSKVFPSRLSFLDQEAINGDQLKQMDCPIFLPGIQQ